MSVNCKVISFHPKVISAYSELIGERLIFDHTKFHLGNETVKLVHKIIDGPSYMMISINSLFSVRDMSATCTAIVHFMH